MICPFGKAFAAHRPGPTRRVGRNGFTLLEVLVSLVIFGIITLALSMALAESLRAQSLLQNQEEHSARIRAAFDLITRDIEAAYGTLNSPSSVFVGSGRGNSSSNSASSSSVAPGSLLAFSSLSHRIIADDLTDAASTGRQNTVAAADAASQNGMQPQSDCNLVRYDLDTQAGILRRTITTIPNLQLLTTNTDPGVQTVITDHVVSLTLRYWDMTQLSWRDTWDFEQQNQAPPAATTTGQSTAGTQTAAATSSPSASSSTATGDTALPGAVEVTLVLRTHDGSPMSYVTVIPVIAPQPQTNATGTAAPIASTGSAGTTTGGTGTGNR